MLTGLTRTAGLLVALWHLDTGPLRGQDGGTGADSLLMRLTAEAVAASPAVLRQDAMARAAATRIRPAGALPDPMINVGVMDLTLPHFRFRESDFTEVDVEFSQQFPWPGTLGAQTRNARAVARGAEANSSVVRRETAIRVAMLYYRLRYVATAQRTLLRQRALLEGGVEISTARYGSGSVPQSDPLLARVALSRLAAEDAVLRAAETGLRADLRAIRGIRAGESLAIAPIAYDTVYAILAHADTLHAGHLAQVLPLSGHPRLMAAQASVDAAQNMVVAEQLGGRPDFEITTRYGARPLGSDFFSAFLGIRVPLWSARKQRQLVAAARQDVEAAQQAALEEQSALGAELERTLAEAQAGAIRLRLLVESVLPLSREGVEAILRGYRVGQADFLSVLAAEDSHYRAELETAEVAADHLTHLVMLSLLLESEETR